MHACMAGEVMSVLAPRTVEDVGTAYSTPPPAAPCTSLDCTPRLRALEPPWVDLRFQPRIDWAAGGLRGDCVVGEYDYIFQAYCSPPGARRSGLGSRPSLERLRAADVHAERLPQASFTELSLLLRNQTLLIMGDSVMEQFYNALQCMLRREGAERPLDAAFSAFIEANRPLWMMGKRKMAPKLPQQAVSEMRMLFSRTVTYQPEDVAAAARTADVIVLNWGLHYHNMSQYAADLRAAFGQLSGVDGGPRLVLFQETAAQHFKASDPRGYATGDWEARDRATDARCECAAVEDFTVNRHNAALREVLGGAAFPRVRVLPFYALTRPYWRWHFGNCTHRPNGWNKETCCDCTHFCYSPGMWAAHLHDLTAALRGAAEDGTLLDRGRAEPRDAGREDDEETLWREMMGP